MYKKLILGLIMLLCVGLIGCDPNDGEEDKVISFDFYSLNDLHGAIFDNDSAAGISKIGQYLIEQKADNGDKTIILSGGDMFQGTAVSSMSRGRVIVDAMNIVGFDAMTVGNHEFDWGIDAIKAFHDGNDENGEADFPFLAANIVEKDTNELVDWVQPYQVIEKSGVKIGIIGLIGEAQINDILASIVRPYEFTNQMDAVKKYTSILRNNENCDIVIVSTHSGYTYQEADSINSGFSYELSRLTGENKIDAIFNAHTHAYYAGEFSSRGRQVPYVQSGSDGRYIGKITLEFDAKTKEVVDAAASNIATKNNCRSDNQSIINVINNYQEIIDIANEKLGTIDGSLDRNSGATWAANVIKEYTGANLGIVNYGGIRSAAFPIVNNVYYSNIFQISPFENFVMTVTLTGEQIKYIIENDQDSLVFASDISSFDDNQTYTVATIDYVFEKDYYNFYDGTNIVNTNIIFREYLAQEVKNSCSGSNIWNPSVIVGPQK